MPVAGLPGQPQQAYIEPLPLSGAKFRDLAKLKEFVSDKNKPFFDKLPHNELNSDESASEYEYEL